MVNVTGFNNQAYSVLVEDLLNDAFYLDARSRRGTISTIRQYSEVIVRKILNLPNDEFVTLGNKKIVETIKTQSNDNPLLLGALKEIKEIGNKCTHTQSIEVISEQDVSKVINSLFDLYAYLFIAYFEKYRFGDNLEIVTSFSILPPIIRYITLKYLYDNDRTNISVIDKLSLAILKAFDEHQAIGWLNERREELLEMSSVSEEGALHLEKERGKDVAMFFVALAPNMYQLCSDRVKLVANILEENGRLYYDFESAIEYYKKDGVVDGETPEIVEFNSLMEFVYLGRKARYNEMLNNRNAYTIYNFL